MNWRHWLSRRSAPTASIPSRRFRPRIEWLEDRTLPANTFLPLPASTGVTVTPPAVASPGSVVAGDFNGDGKIDLAVASGTIGNVSIMLNNGRGNFTPGPTLVPPGTTPAGTFLKLAAGDYNGDGQTDLAVVNTNTNTLFLFIAANNTLPTSPTRSLTSVQITGGAVGATLTSIVTLPSGVSGVPDSIVVGGLDATFAAGPGFVVQLTNDGNFTPGGEVSTGSAGSPIDMAVGNFNGVGGADLATVNSTGSVSVLLGNAAGTKFSAGTAFFVFPADNATSVTTGSLRGNGLDDIIVTDTTGNLLGVLLNNGSGTFPMTATTVGAAQGFTFNAPNGIRAADFNGDGKADLAVLNTGTGTVSVLLTTGTTGSTFVQPTGSPYATNVGAFVSGLTVGKFTGTGRFDIGVAGNTPAVQVLQNQVPRVFFAVGSGTGAAPSISIYDEKGAFLFSFNPLSNASFTGGIRVAVGDVNGDGQVDLGFTTGPGGNTFFALLDGNALFTAFASLGNNPTALSAALLPQEVGQFFFPVQFNGGAFIAIAHFDGNPRTAQVVVSADAGGGAQVSLFSVNPTTLVSTQTGLPSFYAFPNQPGVNVFTGGVRIAVGDVNGDGKDDLIASAGFGGGSQVNVYLGTANGSFLLLVNGGVNTMVGTVPSFYATGNSLFSFGFFPTAADFNGDGKADLIFGLNQTSSQVSGFDANKVLTGTTGTVPQPSFFALQGTGGSSYAGGVRVGNALVIDPNTNGGELIRSLLTVLGPSSAQLQILDLFTSFTAPAGTFPRVVLGPLTPVPTTSNGYYVSG